MPVKKKTKQPAFSESEEEDEKVFEQDSDKEDEQIVGYIGAADELGNLDESQFTEQDEVKQKKGQNFIRKSLYFALPLTLQNFRLTFPTTYLPKVLDSYARTPRRPRF